MKEIRGGVFHPLDPSAVLIYNNKNNFKQNIPGFRGAPE